MGSSLTKLYSGVFGKLEARIAVVGLDGVGKTTILYKLKLGQIVSTIPTIGFNVETLEYNNICFTVWDFTGQHRYKIRDIWKYCFHETQGLVYVVDSTDRDRMNEARDELHTMLNQDLLRDAVVLVLANKQDHPNAMNENEIFEKLQLHTLSQIYWHIQCTCATSGEGLYEGMNWLSKTITMVVESRLTQLKLVICSSFGSSTHKI